MAKFCKLCGNNLKSVWTELYELNKELDKEYEKFMTCRVILKKD